MQNKLRMTIEELKELKPTFEKPIELETDKKSILAFMRKIRVVGVYLSDFAFIDTYNRLRVCSLDNLGNYPSFKKEKKLKKFYQAMVRRFDSSDAWCVLSAVYDEDFRDSAGNEICGEKLQRKLLTDRVFMEIEVDDDCK